MKVLKFGGKSLAEGQPMELALNIIGEYVERGGVDFPLVVVSARGKTTDTLLHLIDLARQGKDYLRLAEELIATQAQGADVDLTPENQLLLRSLEGISLLHLCTPEITDRVLAFGELCSAKVVAALLHGRGYKAVAIDSGDFMLTDSRYGDAAVMLCESEQRCRACIASLDPDTIAVVTGFIARDEHGHRTTLGRNGSNYSAALIANFVHAAGMENYTNVDGIYSAHPEIVLNARKINELSYAEASELAQFGANVLHYKTIDPLQSKEIPLRVLNSFHPMGSRQPGTVICACPADVSARAIAALRNKAAIHFEGREMLGQPGIDARIFAAFGKAHVSVGMVSQGSTERGTVIMVDDGDAEKAVEALQEEFAAELHQGLTTAIYAEKHLAVVALVGVSLACFDKPYVALVRNGIVPQLINNSPNGSSLFLMLEEEQVSMALNIIHGEIFEHPKRIHVACIGHGNVGGAFLNQIIGQHDIILRQKELDLRVFAVAGRQRLLLCKEGMGNDWKERYEIAPREPNPVERIIEFAHRQALENVVVIDNTASAEVATRYIELAESGFDLISSNKIFNTGPMEKYLALRKTLDKHRRSYRYETNVGAGLPLIDNLRLLHLAGDKITRIRGLFSGSLGYVFSRIGEGSSLADALAEARELGFTEPDPRMDLSGWDVAGKLLILARELDVQAELTDIDVQNLVPPALQTVATPEFMERLARMGEYYRIGIDLPADSVLRYVGEFVQATPQSPAIMRCALMPVSLHSALGQVRGADSCFEIYTRNYGDKPIIIQGAGAGADVTAQGIFGDLLRIAERVG